MRRFHTALAGVLLLGSIPLTFMAQSAPAATGATLSVEALLAMSPSDRKAYLKGLAPSERRGLWFEVKKAEVAQRGAQPKVRGSGMTSFPLNPSQMQFWPKPPALTGATRSVGTIAYDNGFPTIGFGGGELVGNRFNTHTGIPVLASGTVETVQALVVPGPANTTSSVGFVIEGPQTVGGGAMAVFSTFTAATGVIDSVTFAGLGANYTGSSFMVLFGDFASVYIPVFGTGTTLGQGHHGLVGYTGGMGPDIASTFDFGGALNSFVRTSGNIVPVELMKYDVI